MEKNQMILEAYMSAYLYELETMINKNNKIFEKVKFQQDEANTDKDVKEAIKKFIVDECNRITLINQVSIDNVTYNIDKNSFVVEDALIPDDYDSTIHNLMAQENAMYVNPDLVLKCSFFGKTVLQRIELKSTKSDKIPGSSVQQVLPDEWVIFIQHKDGEKIKTITGKYKDSISGKMAFPDRSPRPQISYSELKKWIDDYRVTCEETLTIKKDNLEKDKEELLNNWQEVLSKRWLNVLRSDKKENEPWFNNNLRKFILEFLNYYDALDENGKKGFKDKVFKNIDNED